MKRLIVCCDGTWQSQDNIDPTNVLKIAQAVKPMAVDELGNIIPQVLYYDQGIGVVPSRGGTQSLFKGVGDSIEKLGGGAFGWSIDEKIEEAYIFLCLNYCPGDEIYLFGFSRGAYTVRSLAGLINCSGLLQRPDIGKTGTAYKIYRLSDDRERQLEAEKFRQINAAPQVEIKFLGCWDTVGALGIPDFTPLLLVDDFFNVKYQFHDTELSTIIQNARHAIAIDEKRSAFNVTIMKPGQGFTGTLGQVWFPGDHSSVGGGTKENLGLSNAALKWMAEQAGQLGLDLELDLAENTEYINSKIPLKNNCIWNSIGERERNITKLNDELDNGFKFTLNNNFHPSVRERWCDLQIKYRPQNLVEFIKGQPSNTDWY